MARKRVQMASGKKLGVMILATALIASSGALVRRLPLAAFIEYWTAAHLLVSGQNPYSLSQMMALQQEMGWTYWQPYMVLSPPPFLPLLVPLGYMRSFWFSRLVWMWITLALIGFLAGVIWNLYGGERRLHWVAAAIAVFFIPVWYCLASGQIAPFLLLGVVGFLYFQEHGHPFLAGASLALTAFKPHIVYLLWLALLLQSIKRPEWRLWLGVTVSISVLMGLALLFDPRSISEYLALMRSGYTWPYTPSMGGMLRSFFGTQHRWLQFAPMVPGVAGLVWYWRRHASDWRWRDQLPTVLSLSVLTAGYGWPSDEIVLLVPILMVAARCVHDFRLRFTATAWLGSTQLATFAGALHYGGITGATVICALGVMGYLIFDAVTARRRVVGVVPSPCY